MIEWMLGLERLRLERDAPLLLRWNSSAPAWLLFGLGLLAAAWVAGVYRKEHGPRLARLMLGVMRFALFVLVVAVLCQPSLVLQRNRVERSQVALLVDASASMGFKDVYRGSSLGEETARGAGISTAEDVGRYDRLTLARNALLGNGAAPLKRILEVNSVQLLTFGANVEPRAFAEDVNGLDGLIDSLSAVEPKGTATHLASALAGAMDGARGRRLAAIVLVSDGQSTQSGDLKPAIDMAADRQVPILPLRIGSPTRLLDVEMGPIAHQEAVFVGDVAAIDVPLAVRGASEPTPIVVDVIDDRTRELVASAEAVVDAGGAGSVEVRMAPTRPGELRLRATARPLPGELNTENNSETVLLTVQDRRARVLYVEGYPRFEYRYLKNALIRERSVELSVLLLEADEEFVQEGADPIRRFPETMDELGRYDVVLFGDVDPRGGWLSSAQESLLLEFVRERGGGFGVIAGERATPSRWRGTELEMLLPVRIDSSFLGKYGAALVTGFAPRLTAEGEGHRLLRFAVDRERSRAVFEALPPLYWIARTLGPKPGARVLVEAATGREGEAPQPLVVMTRYGAGTLVYQGTDDTWRWRRHTGELLHDGYWVRMVRELLPESGLGADRRWVLRTDRRTYPFGEPVHVELEVFDGELLNALQDNVEFRLIELASDARRSQEDSASRQPESAADAPSDRTAGVLVASLPATRLDASSNRFEAAIVPPRAGAFRLELTGAPTRPGETPPVARVRVESPDLELRRPEADHDALERMAAATGGQVIGLDQLAERFSAIRDRSVQTPDDITEPLWDSPLAMMLFVMLVGSEWVLRKAFGWV